LDESTDLMEEISVASTQSEATEDSLGYEEMRQSDWFSEAYTIGEPFFQEHLVLQMALFRA